MFHPTRPFVRWSSVDIRRAKENGGSYVVENVMPTKHRARLVLNKGADHNVESVLLRKL